VDWSGAIAGAIAGAVTGTLTSVIAPWMNWTIEKRREERDHRRKLIANWRAMLAHYVESTRARDFLTDHRFLTLRPLLTPLVLTSLETVPDVDPRDLADGALGIAADPDLELLAHEIDRIERQWGLG
jgi:hypothetical protein